MQVGISQLILPNLPMGQFLAQAAAADYQCVEICMRRSGDLTLNSRQSELKRIVQQAHGAGIEIASMCHSHCTGNLLAAGDAQRTAIEQTCTALRAAAVMGIDCTLHTLGKLDADLYYDDAYRNAVAAMKKIATTAQEVGVTLAIELVWNGFLFSPLEMRGFLDEVSSPRIGFYFDPGNMAVFQFPQHWVRILGQHLKMVHLKDWKGRALNGGWTPLLEGDVDFAAINRELRTIGYNGPMISEVEPSLAPIDQTALAIRKIISM